MDFWEVFSHGRLTCLLVLPKRAWAHFPKIYGFSPYAGSNLILEQEVVGRLPMYCSRRLINIWISKLNSLNKITGADLCKLRSYYAYRSLLDFIFMQE